MYIIISMKKNVMLQAFKTLDKKLDEPVTMLIGGGAAMLLAYDIPLTTMDVDGLPLQSKLTPAELDPLIKEVAHELKISPHWYNDYFNTFTHTLPRDFRDRLNEVYRGRYLTVSALGMEDLLIMKCFAGREKDIGHARALIKRGADLGLVERRIDELIDKGLPDAEKAADFLSDVIDQMGE